jgi:phosphoribosyl 1,2-cyclic phosphodiesterase
MGTMHHLPEDIPEFALTKERVLAARAADEGPCPDLSQPVRIECPGRIASLELIVIGSGSKGNCTVVACDEGAVMVDCGFSARHTLKRLELAGFDPTRIAGIILTHEHADHFSGVDVLSRKLDVPIYTAEGTARVPKVAKLANILPVHHRAQLRVGGIEVTCFPTSHDAADPIGMRFERGGDAVGYATDTGFLSAEGRELLSDCRVLALESNHDLQMLRLGPYPGYLKQRIMGDEGHLSNEQASDTLASLLCNRLECIVGMHLSQVNNLPELASRSLAGTVRQHGHPAQTVCASQGRTLIVS